MADHALDTDALRRDRDRYQGLVDQAESQIVALQEQADLLQQAVEGFDRLLALAGQDVTADGGATRGPVEGRSVPALAPPAPTPAPAPARKASATKKAAPRAPKKAPPPPTSNPAAPEPVEPPAAGHASSTSAPRQSPDPEAPKGTEALRLVLESDPARSWALVDLLDALSEKGWLPTSRRPEEGVRISLKRLTERGGATRTEDGRWRAPGSTDGGLPAADDAGGTWPPADEPDLAVVAAPAADAAPAAEEADEAPEAEPAPRPPPPALPVSFGRPVGGTITEL